MNLFSSPPCANCGGNLLPVTAQHSYAGSINAVIYECEDCGRIWQQSINPQPQPVPELPDYHDFDAGLAFRCNQPRRGEFYRSDEPKIYSVDK
jgi:hypothetical protein